MPRRWLPILIVLLSFVFGGVAHAKKARRVKQEEGTLVEVQVVDDGGHAIPNAWVRVPDTEGRRSVKPDTGVWSARYLYRFDGSEYYFKPGMVLKMTISAPGYQPRVARYRVRHGRNEIHVVLSKLPQEQAQADSDITWFRRDSVPPDQAAPPPPPGDHGTPQPPAKPAPSSPEQPATPQQKQPQPDQAEPKEAQPNEAQPKKDETKKDEPKKDEQPAPETGGTP